MLSFAPSPSLLPFPPSFLSLFWRCRLQFVPPLSLQCSQGVTETRIRCFQMEILIFGFYSLGQAAFDADQGKGTQMRQPVEHRRSNWIQLSRMGFSDFPVKKLELQNDQVDLAIVQELLS